MILFGKEFDLSDTNQQRGSTDLIQTTSEIALIFQNSVKKGKEGCLQEMTGFGVI